MNRRHRSTHGFTLLETMIVIAIFGIIAAVTIPKITEASVRARETAAIQHLRTIHTAQASYFGKHSRFAENIAQLGPPPGSGLISKDLAKGEKLGYRYAIVTSAAEGYAVTAHPEPAQTVGRSFYSDGSLVIRHAAGGGQQPASAESPEIGADAGEK